MHFWLLIVYKKLLARNSWLVPHVLMEPKVLFNQCSYFSIMVHSSWMSIISCSVVYFTYVCFVQADGVSNLKQVHVIFRHGERTPADTYPNDPYINYGFEPFGWGQLTNKGKLDQFHQGEFLRQRYNTFLGDLYSPEVVKAFSTDADRTKMSVMLELAGLFPPAPRQQWHSTLKWQPIPLHVEPLDQDSLLLVRIPCPRYQYELENVMKRAEVKEILETKYEASRLYTELTDRTGLEINNPDDVQSLYSTLKAEESFNLTLPEWTRAYYPDVLIPLTEFSFVLNAYNDQLQKLKGGPLLKKVIKDSKGKIDGTVSQKIFLYGGHDSTVANLLQALKVWDPQVPGYGILVMVELQERDNVIGFEIYLRNSTIDEPYPLTVPGCSHFCPLNTFITLTANVIPGDDFAKECEVSDVNFSYNSSSQGSLV